MKKTFLAIMIVALLLSACGNGSALIGTTQPPEKTTASTQTTEPDTTA